MKARSQSSLIQKKRSSGGQKMDVPNARHGTQGAILRELRRLGEERNIEGMARFGIVAKNVFGVSKPKIDDLARKIGRNHALGLRAMENGQS